MSKLDYIPYIDIFKAKYKMGGQLSFEHLNDEGKKKVLLMIREAIEVYITELALK